MTNKIKSARGSVVDFDLLKIKNQIQSSPKPTIVQARENFVESKLKRRIKKLTQPIEPVTDNQTSDQQEKVETKPSKDVAKNGKSTETT